VTAHGATHGTAHGTTHRAAHLLLQLALAHLTLTELVLPGVALAGVTLAHRAGTLGTMSTGACGQLRRTAGQLGRAAHGATHLLLRLHRLRTRYCGGHRRTGTALVLRFRRLAHAALLLVLRSGAGGCGELRAQVLVLSEKASQFAFDLVEEGIDLVLVIAFSEADGRELLVPHVLGGQRHLFTST
jgi:hypothetical protein